MKEGGGGGACTNDTDLMNGPTLKYTFDPS